MHRKAWSRIPSFDLLFFWRASKCSLACMQAGRQTRRPRDRRTDRRTDSTEPDEEASRCHIQKGTGWNEKQCVIHVGITKNIAPGFSWCIHYHSTRWKLPRDRRKESRMDGFCFEKKTHTHFNDVLLSHIRRELCCFLLSYLFPTKPLVGGNKMGYEIERKKKIHESTSMNWKWKLPLI